MKIIKANNQSYLLLVLILLSFTTFNSCKKSDSTETTPLGNGTLLFHLHTDVYTNEVDNYGDTLLIKDCDTCNSITRRIVVTKAQLYLSGIKLVKSDGTLIDGPAINILKVKENEQYTLGTVTAGNYESVKFNIGLSAATNAATPSNSDATLHQPDMWFNSITFTPGSFVFVNFQGLIDTASIPNSSNQLIPFNYKIGTNAQLKTLQMPNQNFTVVSNQSVEVHMIIDYAKLFTGIQLNNSANLNIVTAADNALPLATQVGNNITSMFQYE